MKLYDVKVDISLMLAYWLLSSYDIIIIVKIMMAKLSRMHKPF